MTIFISGNVPSSKNSKQWTGKHLIHSKTVRNYLKQHEMDWAKGRLAFEKLCENKEFPLKISFYFKRETKRRFDYVNVAQLPLDLMVKYCWIPDDSADYVIPVFAGYEIDKTEPGVFINVL